MPPPGAEKNSNHRCWGVSAGQNGPLERPAKPDASANLDAFYVDCPLIPQTRTDPPPLFGVRYVLSPPHPNLDRGIGVWYADPSETEEGYTTMTTQTKNLDLSVTGVRLRARRHALGWTQQKLAGELGTSQARISDWEAGRFEMLSSTLVRVCRVMEVSSDHLLGLPE